ncbi:MAG: hypothetical protein IT320_13925 [Anaerolineae bacterium]|nr:hypothetical protein [Anaerolineae bacterium]
MPLFIWFVLVAVVVGAGAMLAPAWNTAQPRISLAAALALALVVGGAVFIATLFGWVTLVFDYLLFALVTSIFLFGTLTLGQRRAEARGIDLEEFDEGWTGPRDLLFFAFVALIYLAPVLIFPVPLGTDAQGFGYLGLMLRSGGTLDTLAPFQPDVHYLYTPAFTALIAYLSQQLHLGLHQVQFAISAAFGALAVWLAYDFGSELQDKRLGRAMALAMLIGIGLYTAYLDSHFTAMLALVFMFAFFICVLRYLREQRALDAVVAGLLLGAVVITHPDTTIILGLGFVTWLLTMWLGKPRPTLRTWLVLLIGVPLIAVIATLPWLMSIRSLLGAEIVSPFTRDPGNWRLMTLYQGVIILPFALIGAIVGLRKREQPTLLAIGWLILIFDFAVTGVVESVFGGLLAPIFRYDYPFSIAWHGPIIPLAILGGRGLLAIWDQFFEGRFGVSMHRAAVPVLGAGIVAVIAGILLAPSVLPGAKDMLNVYGAFSSAADVDAMEWLKKNTPADTLILNHPGPHEADWAPVIAERETIYFRPQPFFQDDGTGEVGTVEVFSPLQEQMLAFWSDPADEANADLLTQAGIDYVLVPQVVGNPNSFATMFRWREPFTEARPMESCVCDAPYLNLVFEEDGAQVYAVAGSTDVARGD